MSRHLSLVLLALLTALGVPSRLVAGERPAPLWSGMYVGAHVGYGWGDTTIGDGGTVIANPPFGAFSCGPALSGNYCGTPLEVGPKGWVGGLQAGANWRTGNMVVGAEGEFGRFDVNEDKTLVRPFDDRDFGSVHYGWYGTLTGRLGFVHDKTMIYAKGGAAFADIRVRAADIDLTAGNFAIYQGSLIEQSKVRAGWALGGGLDYALSRQTSLKVEYLYMDFGSETARSSDGDIYKFDNALQTVKVGLDFHFLPY